MLGVDLVIPDIAWLQDRVSNIRGIVLTHGHEDHIGALPYVLPRLPVPVYGTALTLGFLRNKLREHGLIETTELHTVRAGEARTLGCFEVEWVHATHSIPDACALVVRTPLAVDRALRRLQDRQHAGAGRAAGPRPARAHRRRGRAAPAQRQHQRRAGGDDAERAHRRRRARAHLRGRRGPHRHGDLRVQHLAPAAGDRRRRRRAAGAASSSAVRCSRTSRSPRSSATCTSRRGCS